MDKYINYVIALARGKVNNVFVSSDDEQAITVLSNIFKNADKEVRILAGSLCSKIANDPEYISSLSDFIERNGKVMILLNKFNENEAISSNLYKRLSYYSSIKKNIVLKSTDAHAYMSNDTYKKEVHFTIADNNAYRIEFDIENKIAECNFNDSVVVEKLKTIYDGVFFSKKNIEVDLLKIFYLGNNGRK
ncbi:hypothetical protein [Macellibacteroides fermentans]